MAKAKVAVTLSRELLKELDDLVTQGHYRNRSQAIETAVAETLRRAARTRLTRELAKVDPVEEKAMAEEGMTADVPWPEY